MAARSFHPPFSLFPLSFRIAFLHGRFVLLLKLPTLRTRDSFRCLYPPNHHNPVASRLPITWSPITAGFISIDRFLQNRAPIFYLCFDGIGARHPGVTLGGGARSPGQNPSPLSDRSRKSTTYLLEYAFHASPHVLPFTVVCSHRIFPYLSDDLSFTL